MKTILVCVVCITEFIYCIPCNNGALCEKIGERSARCICTNEIYYGEGCGRYSPAEFYQLDSMT